MTYNALFSVLIYNFETLILQDQLDSVCKTCICPHLGNENGDKRKV